MAALRREQMLDVADSAVKFALKQGASEVEAYTYQGVATSVGVERGQIAKSSRIIDQGIGVRTIVNKAVGFAYTNVLEGKAAFEETVVKALKTARASRPDEGWRELPSGKPLTSVERTFDEKIANLQPEDLVDAAFLMLESAEKTDKRVFPIEGGVGASHLSVAVANSGGVEGFDEGTYLECSLATICQDRSEVTPVCFEFNAERSYDIDPEWVGKESARLALSALKPKSLETRSVDVVFTQFAFPELLSYTLVNAVKADYVQRDQSVFKGRIGQKVASDMVTIYDDGLLAGGLRTWRFDGEGCPHQKTGVMEKGVLRGFVYDNYTAKKDERTSTGNATRAGYLSTPSVDVTNFHIAPGNKSPEDLVDEVDDGLLVYYLQGAHSSNPVSGDFSVVATPAWKIRKGEITHATKGAMVAGNLFELMKNISTLGSNERKVGGVVAPWILVEDVKVIGK